MARFKKGSKKFQDQNEIRQCKECSEKKLVTLFIRGKGDLYRYMCKECGNKKTRTGKISETRFKIGQKSLGATYKKGNVPWYKQKGLEHPCKGIGDWKSGNRYTSLRYRNWKRQVLKKCDKKCMKCGSDYRLSAHHIKSWKNDESLRFDVENGMALCNVCHGKEEGFQKGHKMSDKNKRKSSNTKLIRFLEKLIEDSYGFK